MLSTELACDPDRYLLKRNKNLHPPKSCTWLFIAALFMIARGWKQPKYPSMAEQMRNTRSVHAGRKHLAVKRSEALAQAAAGEPQRR